jgi:DNA-binding CsgD family transcriptional regulator
VTGDTAQQGVDLETPNLLERERELEDLGAAIAAAARGEGSSVLIRGPAGIGKTALNRAARERAAAEGATVLFASGGHLERELPWAIVRELFARPLHELEGEAADSVLSGSAALARSALEGAEGVERTEVPPDPSADALAAALHGLYWLTSNLAERRPLVLAVDDVHVADPASLRFLGYLSARVGDLPVLLLATTRPEEPGSEPLPEALLAATRVLQPQPLSETGAGDLLDRERGRQSEPEFAAACHAVTAGNPYLVRELAIELRQEGIEPTAENVVSVRGMTPGAISRGTLLRVARFGEPAVRLVEAIAVLGGTATLADSAPLAEMSADDVASVASQLSSADLLGSGLPLRFSHPIVRDAVYQGIGEVRRARLHSRAASALAERGASADELAVHLMHTEPGADPGAIETLRDAARGSLAGGVPESAAGYLRRALSESPEPRVRGSMLLELAMAAAATGDPAALEHLEEALSIAESPRERAGILLELGWMLFNAGRPQEAGAAFGRGREELGEADDELAAELRTAHLGMRSLGGDLDPSQLESFIEGPVESGTPGARAAERQVLIQLSLARVLTAQGSEEARRLAERALGDGAMLAEAGPSLTFSIAASCLIWADALDSAEREIEVALAQLAERGDALGTAYVRFGRSWVCYWSGRVREAAADAETAVRAWSAGGRLAGQLPLARYWHAISLLELDETDAAEEALGEEGEEWPEHYRMNWRNGRARIAIAKGDFAGAWKDLRSIEAAAAEIPFLHAPIIPWRSEAAIAAARLGEEEDARRLAQEDVELTRRFGAPRALGIALRGAAMVEGGERGTEQLAESVSVLERSPSQLELCRSLVELGGALRRAGTPASAGGHLSRALEMAHRLGAVSLERQAREELAMTGARPRRAELSGPQSLTPGERRVCDLAAEGLTNREIAQQLFVSLRTVETHLTHAYQKLDISSREELGEALAPERR